MSRIYDMATGQNLSSTTQKSQLPHQCPTDRPSELALRLLSVAESEEQHSIPPRPRPWFTKS